MLEPQDYDAQGRPIPSKPVGVDYDAQGKPIAASGAFAGASASGEQFPEGMIASVGNHIIDLAAGGLKSLGQTAMSVPHLAAWLADKAGSPLPASVQSDIASADQALAPTNTTQSIGAMGGQVAQALLPLTKINQAAELAGITTEAAIAKLAQNSPRLASAGGLVARAGVQGAAQAGMAAAQGGDPTTAGVMGAVIPAVGELAAPALKQGAEDTMVLALGKGGASGPAGKVPLANARRIAPDLLDQGFRATTQRGALAKATDALSAAKSAVSDAWASLPTSGKKAPVSSIIDALEQRQQALSTPVAGVTPDASLQAVNALESVKQDVIANATLGPNGPEADLRDLRALRQSWDDALNYVAADPAKGATKLAYQQGARLVRATINGSDDAIATANADYSRAEKLVSILQQSTDRPATSSAWSPALRYGIGSTVGGAIGYKEGGVSGMAEGAIAGASIARLVSSPGWRYVSANLKNSLAQALDQGNQTRTGQILTTIVSQMAGKQ